MVQDLKNPSSSVGGGSGDIGAANIQDEDRPSNTLELFTELPEVLEMIAQLPEIYNKKFEKMYEQFRGLIGKYQEQPHLLDPHLEQLIINLLEIVRGCSGDGGGDVQLGHCAFKYLYQLTKVRTFKAIEKFLPHEITDLELVLVLLEQQSPKDSENWESRYFLLLWLSILIINPFAMSRLDGNSSSVTELTIAERIYQQCIQNTSTNDACTKVGAYLSAKFLIRIDCKDKLLPAFFQWTCLNENSIQYGQLAAVAAILKHGKREDILPHADHLIKWFLASDHRQLSDYLKSRYFIKIFQRLGLVLLPPRLAVWRYKRGSRSLTANLEKKSTSTEEINSAVLETSRESSAIVENEDGDDIYVPDQIEDIVDELLEGLRSPSSDIRWSAAKGIGRVTNRLPKSMGDDVVGSVIEIINPLEPHEAWHGGCLAIAELSKRGLLLPYRLEAMVPILLQALIYDEMKGYMSVGQHIRDAACYVSWAFARAYEPSVLEPFIQNIAAGLIVTTVFDREINCRRAASAAFQESVGRLGNFPHGIDILTEADFYTVGVRANSYLNISGFVAQFKEYTQPLVDHLIEHKTNHWDIVIREITAKTLFKLTARDPVYMAEVILPKLFRNTDSIDVNQRHGSVLAIGEICLALKSLESNEITDTTSQIYLTNNLITDINGLILKFLKRDQFRGLSGDLMNQCCCDFIRNCSKAKILVSNESIESWQTIIDSCIKKNSLVVRDSATLALAELCETYYLNDDKMENNLNIIKRYLNQSDQDLEENCRMGSVSALGVLPKFMILSNLSEIIGALIKHSLKFVDLIIVGSHGDAETTRPTGAVAAAAAASSSHQLTNNWAESRRDSIKALCRLVLTIGFETNDIKKYLPEIFDCFLVALQEYTIDDRGDIGAWVREASMTALHSLITTCPTNLLRPDYIERTMCGFAQQAVETIDRTRGLAGSLFCKLINHEPEIPYIPHHEELKTIFPDNGAAVLWIYADHTFPMFCELLGLKIYSERLILGLTASVGKLSESLVKHSSTAMFQFLRAKQSEVPRICNEIVYVFEMHLHNDRITQSLLNFLELLIASGTINKILHDESSNFANEIFRLTKLEIKGQKKLYKLISSINVFCQLIQVPWLSGKVLSNLMIFLGSTHVHVRKSTATKLYEAIVIYGGDSIGFPDENIDEILEILSETDWGLPLTQIRPIRNNLCVLLGTKPPVSAITAAATSAAASASSSSSQQ